MNLKNLRDLAKHNDIKGYMTLKKSELELELADIIEDIHSDDYYDYDDEYDYDNYEFTDADFDDDEDRYKDGCVGHDCDIDGGNYDLIEAIKKITEDNNQRVNMKELGIPELPIRYGVPDLDLRNFMELSKAIGSKEKIPSIPINEHEISETSTNVSEDTSEYDDYVHITKERKDDTHDSLMLEVLLTNEMITSICLVDWQGYNSIVCFTKGSISVVVDIPNDEYETDKEVLGFFWKFMFDLIEDNIFYYENKGDNEWPELSITYE